MWACRLWHGSPVEIQPLRAELSTQEASSARSLARHQMLPCGVLYFKRSAIINGEIPWERLD